MNQEETKNNAKELLNKINVFSMATRGLDMIGQGLLGEVKQ